jgi:hypothetical protein
MSTKEVHQEKLQAIPSYHRDNLVALAHQCVRSFATALASGQTDDAIAELLTDLIVDSYCVGVSGTSESLWGRPSAVVGRLYALVQRWADDPTYSGTAIADITVLIGQLTREDAQESYADVHDALQTLQAYADDDDHITKDVRNTLDQISSTIKRLVGDAEHWKAAAKIYRDGLVAVSTAVGGTTPAQMRGKANDALYKGG